MINETLADVLILLNDSNFKAHFVDLTENLIEQILKILSVYRVSKGKSQVKYKIYYKDLFEVIDRFGVKEQFQELVALRIQKYKLNFF